MAPFDRQSVRRMIQFSLSCKFNYRLTCMDAMLGAGFFGMAVFLASIPAYIRSKTDDRSPFWHPVGKLAGQRLRRRVRLALSKRAYQFAWSLVLPTGLVGLLLSVLTWGTGDGQLAGSLRWDILGGYLLGAGLGFGGSYFLGLRKAIGEHLQAEAIQAAKAIARRGTLDDAELILGQAGSEPEIRKRLAAAIALRYLGTATGNAILEQLTHDACQEVRHAAKNSLENIQAVLSGQMRESVISLEQVALDYARLDSQLDIMVDATLKADLLIEYHRLKEIFDRVIYAQLPLRRSFPSVYCMDCRCRGEQLHFKDWAWVRCKRCKDVFGLKPGVVVVTGQIGGVEAWELHHGELKLSLWDREERKARGAELDRLEIVGLQDIAYDWAVSAVVEQLHTFVTYDAPRPYVVLTHYPLLSSNSYSLLRTIDPTLAAENHTPLND
jgi:hypothetical protein